jgi:hypothetical protein
VACPFHLCAYLHCSVLETDRKFRLPKRRGSATKPQNLDPPANHWAVQERQSNRQVSSGYARRPAPWPRLRGVVRMHRRIYRFRLEQGTIGRSGLKRAGISNGDAANEATTPTVQGCAVLACAPCRRPTSHRRHTHATTTSPLTHSA